MVKPRIAIVGLGLIGGSLARRLVNAGCEVTAWNHNDRPYATAEADGIICKPTLAALAETKPNVLVLCNPLKAMPEILGALKPLIDTETTTLTDVGSVKGMVRDQVKAIGLDGCYVGAHPMAGNELSGWEASDPTLYDDALWAITVDEHTEYRRFRAVADMIVNRCGNRLIVLDDATHDRCAALISHMPHVIATAMINELVANPNRNIAAAQWLANYFVSWTFPMMDKNSWLVAHFHNGFSYWIYGCMGVLAALFMWKFVPETKGKTLEELEALWEPETKKTQQTATL